jgi:IS5 family transposase
MGKKHAGFRVRAILYESEQNLWSTNLITAFQVLKCQFGYLKARYRGLAKNTAQIETQFALANLWMARKML